MDDSLYLVSCLALMSCYSYERFLILSILSRSYELFNMKDDKNIETISIPLQTLLNELHY